MFFPLSPVPPNETVACGTHILIVAKPENGIDTAISNYLCNVKSLKSHHYDFKNTKR